MLRKKSDQLSTSENSSSLPHAETAFKKTIKGTTVNIYMSLQQYEKHKEAIHPTIVNRGKLMTAINVLGVIPAHGDFHLSCGQTENYRINYQTSPCTVSFKATWFTTDEKETITASDANTFGRSGTLELQNPPPILAIPYTSAAALDPLVLNDFGATLLPVNTTICGFNTSPYPLPVVTYAVHASYANNYLFKNDGGGGAFLEKHVPPHVWVPLNVKCRGALILGKHHSNQHYELTAVSIPYGYMLALKANALHADCLLVGEYAMALSATTDKNAHASTAILRKPNGAIQAVALQPTNTALNLYRDLSIECDTLAFFKKCAAKYLDENRHKNSSIQKQYDECFGLTTCDCFKN